MKISGHHKVPINWDNEISRRAADFESSRDEAPKTARIKDTQGAFVRVNIGHRPLASPNSSRSGPILRFPTPGSHN